jgi:CheY-like chemotaxis protein
VVDDNADAADMLSMVLSLAGHSVGMVNHGLEVLDRAREFRPDIVLLDLGLPGLSGFEIAQQLRASSDLKHVTLIALTGYGQDEDRRQSRAHGFDHHVVKPVDLDALSELINNA